MYAINTSYPVPNRTYTIVADHEYNRYVAYVATLDFGSKVSVGGKEYSAEDLRQMLLQADKVNQNQSTLIARYGCENLNIFLDIVPADFDVKKGRAKAASTPPVGNIIFQTDLNRLDETQMNEGDILWNVYVLCYNPFTVEHNREWVKSFKSTVHVDEFGHRYVFINDDQTRDRCYSWATHKKNPCVINKADAIELVKKNLNVEKKLFVNPNDGCVIPSYKGADMG